MAGMVYRWRLERQFPVEAQVVGERLEALRTRHNGILTPRAVVEDARPLDSKLHPLFEWDDSVAAERFREHQASDVLRSVVVRLAEQKPEARPVRAFVNVVTEKQTHYTSVTEAMSREDLRAQVLAQAMREVVAWRERYQEYEELAEIFAAIDREEIGSGSDA